MPTPAAEARQQARDRAATITAVVARHLSLEPSEISNWTKLGPNVRFIVADVEEMCGPAKRTFTPDDDLVSLLAVYQPE